MAAVVIRSLMVLLVLALRASAGSAMPPEPVREPEPVRAHGRDYDDEGQRLGLGIPPPDSEQVQDDVLLAGIPPMLSEFDELRRRLFYVDPGSAEDRDGPFPETAGDRAAGRAVSLPDDIPAAEAPEGPRPAEEDLPDPGVTAAAVTTPPGPGTRPNRGPVLYSFSFKTDDGVERAERAYRGKQAVTGSFSWTSPDGALLQVEYFADETGFHPRTTQLAKAAARAPA